jgi:arginyl-tRNA synthetase
MSTGQLETAPDPVSLLERAFREAITAVLGEAFREADPLIRASQNPEFGDYQSNCAMGLAKRTGSNPRDLAGRIAEAATVQLAALAEPPQVAGPGFINIRLTREALARLLRGLDSVELGIALDTDQHAIAIDLCGVNIAKQMHVGHLRATIIGDALARVFERRGRRVHRENHLGDWGLTIAMVLAELERSGQDLDALDLDGLDETYRQAQARGESDESAGEAAKATLLRLQQGEPEVVARWQRIIDITMQAVYESFELLNVNIGPEHDRPESFYREELAGVVDAFLASGIGREDDGAIVVPFPDRKRPLLIRKSDGGFLYATTDLAAIRHRVQTLGASRVIYVVDARQRDHFRDVFDAARLIGWDRLPDGTRAELVHVAFGSVLNKQRKPLKTRSGENVTLASLLDAAIERATAEVRARAAQPAAPTHDLSDQELAHIGRTVGIAAVKYADLSNDLVRDYVFDLDRMVAFEGSSGPYLQYAYARICSIFAKAGLAPDDPQITETPMSISAPAERQLALLLLRYPGVVSDVAQTLEPHRLCTYLYDLANTYSTFYETTPVLKAESETLRRSRLHLCSLVRRVLADGLKLLGIDAPTRM